jgi:glycosyltransferase involved in cell wall biosynthesis
MTGFVDAVHPYLAASDIVAIPLFEGGGTRLKALEAFASGLPVVSTTKGVEGLGVRDGEHVLIADTAEAMAAQVARLAADAPLRRRLADAAFALVQQRFSWDAVGARVQGALHALVGSSRP